VQCIIHCDFAKPNELQHSQFLSVDRSANSNTSFSVKIEVQRRETSDLHCELRERYRQKILLIFVAEEAVLSVHAEGVGRGI
jgi:hypothetical protein